MGSDCCCGRRPGVADGNTGAFILGGSDEEEEDEEDELLLGVDEVIEDPDERGRAGRDGGCFDV